MGLFGGNGGSLGSWDVVGNKLDDTFFPDSGGDEAAAEEARRKAAEAYAKLKAPTLTDVELEAAPWLRDATAANIDPYSPIKAQLAALSSLDGTAMDDVSTDPRLKEDQMQSLGALRDLANKGGMNAQDEANLSRVQSQNAQADRGRREAILQNAQARGMGGSGMELLAQLQSSQGATDRGAQQGLDIAGMAQQRALDAMVQGGNLAGNIQNQDFSQQAQVARARDAINSFNAQNANQNSQFNAGNTNDISRFNATNDIGVQQYNASNLQDTNRFNTAGRQDAAQNAAGAKNEGTLYNSGLQKDRFDNDVRMADIQAGVHNADRAHYAGKAAATQAKGAANRATAIKLGTAVATGGGSLAVEAAANQVAPPRGKAEAQPGFVGPPSSASDDPDRQWEGAYQKSDQRAKKNIQDVTPSDLDAFLAAIAPKKYQYKKKKDGEGDRIGVMAQDLAKTDVGSNAVVTDEDGMLGYDKDKMQGIMLAAIKHLSDKIDGKAS